MFKVANPLGSQPLSFVRCETVLVVVSRSRMPLFLCFQVSHFDKSPGQRVFLGLWGVSAHFYEWDILTYR